MSDDLKILFVVIALALFAAASASNNHSQRSSSSSSNPPDLAGSHVTLSTPKSPVPTDPNEISQELGRIGKDLEKIGAEAQKTKTSPWGDSVEIESASPYARESSNEIVTLHISSNAPEKIDITGWEIKSAISGRGGILPQGVRIPYWGSLNTEENIVVRPGDTIYISSGRSPLGVSFLTNLCTGYFEQFQNFTPSLRRQCPRPEDEPIPDSVVRKGYNDACINYIETLSRCRMPLQEDVPENLPAECKSYVASKINYDQCTKNNGSDNIFFGIVWRIYLKQNETLWKERRELIQLLDKEKRIVGSLSY